MVNKQSKYLHFKVYYKFCLRIKDVRANCKTNNVQLIKNNNVDKGNYRFTIFNIYCSYKSHLS